MSDQVFQQLVQSAPQVAALLVVVLGAWLLVREYARLRDQLDGQVQKTVKAELASLYSSLQQEVHRVGEVAAAVEEQRIAITSASASFADMVASREAEIVDRQTALVAQLAAFSTAIPSAADFAWTSPRDLVALAQEKDVWSDAAPALRLVLDDPNATEEDLVRAGVLTEERWRFFSKSLEFYRRAVERDPSTKAKVFLRCLEAELSPDGRDERANEVAELVLENPTEEAMMRFANTCFRLEKYSLLATTMQNVLERHGATLGKAGARAYRELGVAQRELGDVEHADQSFREAFRRSPKDEGVLSAYLQFLEDQQKWDEYKTTVDQLLYLDPLDERYYVWAADYYKMKGEHDRAIECYDEAFELADSAALRGQIERERQRARKRKALMLSAV